MKKIFLTTAAAVLMLSSPAMAKEYTVKMITNYDAEQVYYFEPADLTINPGDTVKWVVAMENDTHNAVADAGPKDATLFQSPMLDEIGKSWTHKFTDQGTYTYHCHPHAAMGMKGSIIVGKASAPKEMTGAPGHGKHSHGGNDSSTMDHSKMKMNSMDHSGMKMEGMDHGKMKMEGMDHSKMKMDHGVGGHGDDGHGDMDKPQKEDKKEDHNSDSHSH